MAALPSQIGRRAVVTGSTGGLGLETALGLAQAGAEVILASRNAAKGDAAVAAIRARVAHAIVSFASLDLADLASVAAFADGLAATQGSLDVLVNNAGVLAPPKRRLTADGFELQFGTNHLGHFALTGRLLPLLREAAAHGRAPRVVSVSSIAHRRGRIDFDDLQGERRYRPWTAYSQSKLANLLFARELQRRSAAAGWGVASIAAHPGVSATDLFASGPALEGATLRTKLVGHALPLFGQSAAAGARPILFAATAPAAVGGGYYGPDGWMEMRGAVAPARVMPQGRDASVATRLWEVSEALTGVVYPSEAGG